MPRSPEYVKAKPYKRWEGLDKEKIAEDLAKARKQRGTKEKPGKPEEVKDKAEEKPGKGSGGDKATTRKGERAAHRAIEPKRPGKDVARGGKGGVEPGTPPMGQNPPIWGGRWEVVRPDALEGRRALPPAPPRGIQPVPERPALASGRQFQPKNERALGPGHGPVNEQDRRQRDLAQFVQEHMARNPKPTIEGGSHTDMRRDLNLNTGSIHEGVIVSEDHPSKDLVAQNDSQKEAYAKGNTSEIKAIGPPSHAAVTGPVPVQKARSGDTGVLPRTEYTHDKTTELPKVGRQFSFGDAATVAASTARGAAKGVAKGRAAEAAAALAGPEAEVPVMTGFALRGAAKGAAQGVAKVAAKRAVQHGAPGQSPSSLAPQQPSRQFAPSSPRLALPSGQKAIGSSPHTPQPGIALTQHAEPFGQMSLFQEKGEGNLALAKTSRTERQATVPPSLAAGRQLSLFDTSHPGKFKVGT